MKMGIHQFRTLRGNTLIVEVGSSMTYGRVEDQNGDWVEYYGSISIPEFCEQDGRKIITFTEFGSQRPHAIAIRPVITLG